MQSTKLNPLFSSLGSYWMHRYFLPSILILYLLICNLVQIMLDILGLQNRVACADFDSFNLYSPQLENFISQLGCVSKKSVFKKHYFMCIIYLHVIHWGQTLWPVFFLYTSSLINAHLILCNQVITCLTHLCILLNTIRWLKN